MEELLLKTIALILGIIGALLCIKAIPAMLVAVIGDSRYPSSRCLTDWDGIDGPRYVVGDVAWTTDEQHFRFTVTRKAYWPCSRSQTYLANVASGEVRILEGNFNWYAPNRLSPSGKKTIEWVSSFWDSDEFSVVLFDLDKGSRVEIAMNGLLRVLEERAKQECMPAECLEAQQMRGPQLYKLFTNPGMLVGLVLMMPAFWIRRDRFLAIFGIGFVGLYIFFYMVFLLLDEI